MGRPFLVPSSSLFRRARQTARDKSSTVRYFSGGAAKAEDRRPESRDHESRSSSSDPGSV
jgi:hypothetical protein